MIYFTSDQHWGHSNIIKLCNRPFTNHFGMGEHMINVWNSIVTDNDLVYHLGDFGFKCSAQYLSGIMNRLNGRIILIKGNHDKQTLKANNITHRFESIHEILETDVDNTYVVMCHYPMREWPGYFRNSWHLFGHVHGKLNDKGLPPRCVDVGVDVWNYQPVTLKQIKDHAGHNDVLRGGVPPEGNLL